jgi:glycosyltransferase involved in cell wall biosynthesis
MNKKKYKVLVLSDHALSTSGVGTQTRHLINGLLKKGCWSFRQFGAAIKHTNYDTVVVNEDFIIKPIDGFGDPNLIRVTLATEKPDILFIFTDPRFFTWLFEIEDEVHQMCPIVWWHVWDNYPYPKFNDLYYQATDTINCHSHMTYEMIKEEGSHADKTFFIPHAIPDNLYGPLDENLTKQNKITLLGEDRKDHFVALWVNRNAKRKRPNDALMTWKLFLDNLEKDYGHRNATLIMHTEPTDQEGPNLFETSKVLGLEQNVFFSRDRIEFDKMNVIYNIVDVCFTMSYAEGFGLSTLESMMTGTPIVAPKTGGLTRQVVDHRDGTENGVALPIVVKSLVGSQAVPYIYEDYASIEDAAKALRKLHDMNDEEKSNLKKKVFDYAHTEFSYQKTVDLWHESMLNTIKEFKSYKSWEKFTF